MKGAVLQVGIRGDGMFTIAPFRGKPGGKENGGDREGDQEKAGTRRQMFVELTPTQHKVKQIHRNTALFVSAKFFCQLFVSLLQNL